VYEYYPHKHSCNTLTHLTHMLFNIINTLLTVSWSIINIWRWFIELNRNSSGLVKYLWCLQLLTGSRDAIDVDFGNIELLPTSSKSESSLVQREKITPTEQNGRSLMYKFKFLFSGGNGCICVYPCTNTNLS